MIAVVDRSYEPPPVGANSVGDLPPRAIAVVDRSYGNAASCRSPLTFIVVILLLLAGCSREPIYQALESDAVVLAFGDSVTYGTGASGSDAYPTLLSNNTGWRVINAGVPGDTAREASERIRPLLEEHNPALVIVELGGNDFLRQHPKDQVLGDLRDILHSVRDAGAIPVLIAVPQLSLLRATTGTLSDADLYRQLADDMDVMLIEDVLSGVLSDDTLRADPIHPNARGYEQLTEGIIAGLRSGGLLL